MRMTEQGLGRRHLLRKHSAGNRRGNGPLFNPKYLNSTIQINTPGGAGADLISGVLEEAACSRYGASEIRADLDLDTGVRYRGVER
jgi:hypothetical protein